MQSKRIAQYISFFVDYKMPLNILQQKLQLYTQTGSSRGQYSHWFSPLEYPPTLKKTNPPPLLTHNFTIWNHNLDPKSEASKVSGSRL